MVLSAFCAPYSCLYITKDTNSTKLSLTSDALYKRVNSEINNNKNADEHIVKLLEKYCLECHAPKPKAHSLASYRRNPICYLSTHHSI